MNAGDSNSLQVARRLELDAAMGLGASFLCCVVGLAICWRSYRQSNALIGAAQSTGLPLDIQSRLFSARIMSLAGIVIAFAVPLASIAWSFAAYSLSR